MESTRKTTEPPELRPQAASAAQISAVLGNDDLFREILLRLGFPTSLVRAAAVSKRWLRHASDPAFLRRFRRLHPPRLLGIYLKTIQSCLRFIPLPQPPELAVVIRRGKFDLGMRLGRVSDCRNGRLLADMAPDDCLLFPKKTACRPLHPGRGASALPMPPIPFPPHDRVIITTYAHKFLFHDDGDDDVAISAVSLMCNESHAMVQLQDFQSGVWSECRNSDMIELHGQWKRYQHLLALLANGKIYMTCTTQCILGLDVQSMSLFSIELPNGVEYEYDANIALSRAEGSGFYLIHARKFQMSVWHYTMDYSGTGNWELIDTVPLRRVLGSNADPTWWSLGDDIQVAVVGDFSDFVFFRIQNQLFYFHISSRTVEKVYEIAQNESLYGVSPFMMTWPPTFPTLNGGHDNDE